jgi:imidazolonepropionase
MGNLRLLENGGIAIEGKKIVAVGPSDEIAELYPDSERIDCSGKTVLPGFVDSHTHLVFAGNRSNEFAMRLRGATYQEIYEKGGGIRSTMRAVREASLEEIVETARPLVQSAFRHGSTTIEVKSGYGLDTESELKLLEAIQVLDREEEPELVATFLGAHAFPPEFADDRDAYVRLIIEEMIPEVAERGLAEYCDVFTDEGYFTVAESERILEAATAHEMKVRVHADELADVSAAAMAARVGAVSADHLLKISDEGIDAMAEAGVIATLLPGTAFYLNLPYAPARRLIERGLPVALATDCNPGTNMCENMGMTLALACMGMRLTIEEAITASTLNGAAALDRSNQIGLIQPGYQADIIIADVPTYPDLVYHYGVNQIWKTIKGELRIKN